MSPDPSVLYLRAEVSLLSERIPEGRLIAIDLVQRRVFVMRELQAVSPLIRYLLTGDLSPCDLSVAQAVSLLESQFPPEPPPGAPLVRPARSSRGVSSA